MVGQRILTPSILVRVQVKQPTKLRPFGAFFLLADLPKVKNQAVRNRITSRKRFTLVAKWQDHRAICPILPGEAATNKPLLGAFLVADLPMVKNQAVRGATGETLPVAMTQWRKPSEVLSLIGERCAVL